MNTPTPEREQLVADIKHAGFYPDLVLEVVDEALADMNPDAHFVQHEPISRAITSTATSP